ncbi:DEAD/DEAH box helicase [Pimelobacter simplex]|uniref:ATP-dependent RNA helicase DeaD n=1 Tax=Nocardioides simplex TaxID=2045 RepID=A0A0A1DS97_NOCSI|nr:DEAD/DEAH box helicase [Pimelobacter simplex]AIY19413.1 DEAD-box ATP-dependent RNA helicase CshA [Pimelobacter simplex]MCG8149567.1 DEAD/DEAH box helicase [Pimelobacter simplex]GEB16068.1 ATP-dependent RNA helicase DeaD [Pimelobacter simplex]SFM81457.1 ATP-dependent RNA helicase CsdA [Pimelobacter simplex]
MSETAEHETATFADLGLGERILKALKGVGYESPSAIQAQTIPHLLDGRDVMGLAQTGTGKTAAFALPILDRLDLSQKTPQALVLAPTRELALQVCEAFEKYAADLRGVHVLPVYGGQGYGVQLSALRRGVHIVVGTPGRIMDHLDKGTLDLSELRFLVLDEADEMLNMGFAEDVETILADTPTDKQVALFSATMPKQIKALSSKYLNDPVSIAIERKTRTAENITQRYLIVSYPQKVDALTRILEVENFEGMIVFVRTKSETETLAEKLRARGYSAAAINGDIAQQQRERTVNQLKDGKLDILVATDVAARGLDVERISHVVNYDIPTDTEAYVHRIGRTGRAGRSGDAISFVTPRERYLLKHIEKATRSTLDQMQLPSVEAVNVTRLARFDDQITAALESPQIEFFRDVVGHYIREHDVPEVDVAAALAIAMQGDTPLLLEPEPEPRRGRFDDRGDRGDRGDHRKRDWSADDDRGGRGGRDRGSRSGGNLASYKIQVGKRHRVEPRQIVGALANEGGLDRRDFGKITIRPDYSIVELPANLPPEAWEKLKSTRISGKLIELARDYGPPKRSRKPQD